MQDEDDEVQLLKQSQKLGERREVSGRQQEAGGEAGISMLKPESSPTRRGLVRRGGSTYGSLENRRRSDGSLESNGIYDSARMPCANIHSSQLGRTVVELMRFGVKPLSSALQFVRQLCDDFGSRFVVLIVSVYFGVKGFLYPVIYSGMLPYNKEILRVDGKMHSKIKVIALTPWGMKALFGFVSDIFPIFGYKKKYYILGAAAVGTIAFALLGTLHLEPSESEKSFIDFSQRPEVGLASALFFVGMMEQSIVDILTEGSYAQQMAEKPETGSNIVTWVWTVYQIGGLLAALVTGPLTTMLGPKAIFLFAIPFSVQVLFPIGLGFLPEDRITNDLQIGEETVDESEGILSIEDGTSAVELPEPFFSPKRQRQCACITMDTTLLRNNYRIFSLAIGMALAAMGLIVFELASSDVSQMIYACLVSVILCGLSFVALPRTLALCNTYMFLCEALYVQMDGAMDYFYTAKPNCVADGPHFSWNYYLTYTSLVGTIAGLGGVFIFQTVLSKRNFRLVFWSTMLLRIIASLFDIVIVSRWNTKIGVPDNYAYMLGDAVIYNMTYMINFMPPVVLTSKLCPKNMEATVYALLAGFQNFGQQVAKSIGVYMMHAFKIETEPPRCNFHGLVTMIIIGHMILPALTIPLTFFMLPNKRIDEEFSADDVKENNHNRAKSPEVEDFESDKQKLLEQQENLEMSKSCLDDDDK